MRDSAQEIRFDYATDRSRLMARLHSRIFFAREGELLHENPGPLLALEDKNELLVPAWERAVRRVWRHLSAWTVGVSLSSDGRRASAILSTGGADIQTICEDMLDALMIQELGIAAGDDSPDGILCLLRERMAPRSF